MSDDSTRHGPGRSQLPIFALPLLAVHRTHWDQPAATIRYSLGVSTVAFSMQAAYTNRIICTVYLKIKYNDIQL